MHLATSTTVWYAARAGGVVSYLLVSASVLAGILLAGKARVPGLPRFAVEDVHRFLGLLAGLFIAIHIGSIALDTVVPFSLGQLVIPFTSGYRPLATSGIATRSWGREGGDRAHHLIDPATGLPAEVRWQAVTVCAGTCLAADVAAKAAFLLGDDGPAWLERHGLQGRFVTETEVVLAGGWPKSSESPICI